MPDDTAALLQLKSELTFKVLWSGIKCLQASLAGSWVVPAQQACELCNTRRSLQVTDNSTRSLDTWSGNEVCSGTRSVTQWEGITCLGGRVAAANLSGLGASGPLDAIGKLTALSSLSLSENSFTGMRTMVCCSAYKLQA